jgi:hypothetical protein
MDFLLGILGLILGVVVCLAGLRFFFVLLPVWGFVTGFLAGAALVTAIFGDGFLATTLGIVVGLIFAVVFALFSYLYWYVGALLAAGGAGAILGTSLFATFGVDSDWVLFFVGLAFAAAFVLIALVVNFPVLVVIIGTAFAGSAIAIGGLLLLLNKFDREEIGTGALWQRIDDNLILWLIWLVAAGIGIAAQFNLVKKDTLQIERWAKAEPTPAA